MRLVCLACTVVPLMVCALAGIAGMIGQRDKQTVANVSFSVFHPRTGQTLWMGELVLQQFTDLFQYVCEGNLVLGMLVRRISRNRAMPSRESKQRLGIMWNMAGLVIAREPIR